MKGQEKITLNLSAVDLAKVDYLVEQSFYSSRSDFIRTAMRKQMRDHEAVISDASLMNLVETEQMQGKRTIGGVGLVKLSRASLEECAETGSRVRLFIIGSIVVDRDVPLDLVKRVVEEARIYGTINAPKEIGDYLRRLAGKQTRKT